MFAVMDEQAAYKNAYHLWCPLSPTTVCTGVRLRAVDACKSGMTVRISGAKKPVLVEGCCILFTEENHDYF